MHNGRCIDRESGWLDPESCFCRVLGEYVRERQALTLSVAIRKMSLLPARRLDEGAAARRRGADADIVAFDPATVRDEASFAEPMRRSRGVAEVLVSGVSVVRAGALDKPSSRARMCSVFIFQSGWVVAELR